MKKAISLFLAVVMIFCLCAAGSAEEYYFERAITIVCPWGAGGGADPAEPDGFIHPL